MATGKKYYWIKLRDSFMTSDKVDYLMSQKDGANYIVLYQMLCLKTLNTEGEFARQIGEVLIPYDVEHIQRDCKYFSKDTIVVALNLFKALGMVYEQENGVLKIADFKGLVGCETDYAQQKRNQRGQLVDNAVDNVHTEIRDKRLEIRDKSIESRVQSSDISGSYREGKPSRFLKPSIEEVSSYISEMGYTFSAEAFCSFYESKGWKVGKNTMKDWKACCRSWQARQKDKPAPKAQIANREYDFDELERRLNESYPKEEDS